MKKIFALAVTLALALGMISFAANEFKDISGHWAESTILTSEYSAIFNAQNGYFKPDSEITRSEFAMLLHDVVDVRINYVKDSDITEFFHDVKNDDPIAAKLYDLVTLGIIDKKGSFKPDVPIYREEAVHYIINALKVRINGNYAHIMMMPAPFADDDEIAPEYKNDIVEAVLMKIVNGCEDNKFYPKKNLTRAQAVVLAERLGGTIAKYANQAEVQAFAEKTENGITMRLEITNKSESALTIDHISGQRYDFKLLDEGRNVLYTWSDDKMFTQALTTTVVEPGEKVVFEATFEGEGYKKIKDKIRYIQAFIICETPRFKDAVYEVTVK